MKIKLVLLFALLATATHAQLKWANVERVYNSLVTAIGDGTKIAPPIELSTDERAVAYYSPSKQTVFVEQRFLQICASMGSDSLNALAFILGHELAHFYRNHGWVHSSGLGYVDAQTKANWKELSKDADLRAKDEAEADIFAGFYALVAGHNAMGVAAKTLQTVYRAYGIPDTVAGYPSLQQRMQIANNAEAKSEELYLTFKVGLYSLSTQKFEVATKLFTYIFNQDYAGVEILNNLAVSEILWGYSFYGESPSYVYPLFISTETPLNTDTRGGEAEEHIRKGIVYLKKALEKDMKNGSLMLNLASAFAMLNEFTDAEYYLAKAEAGSKALAGGCANLRGIIAMKKGDDKLAKKQWGDAKSTDALAAMNFGQKFGNPTKEAQLSKSANTTELNMVDAIDLKDEQLKSKFQFKVIKLPGLKISYSKLPTSTLIEVYGGAAVDYRFQSFESNKFEDRDFSWRSALQSTTTTIYQSGNYPVLKMKNSGSTLPEYIKYIVN